MTRLLITSFVFIGALIGFGWLFALTGLNVDLTFWGIHVSRFTVLVLVACVMAIVSFRKVGG